METPLLFCGNESMDGISTVSKRGCQPAYDKEAEQYDNVRFTGPGGMLSSALDDTVVVELLCPDESKIFLDMPAGTARSSVALARTGARVVAMDLSAKMLDRGREKMLGKENLQILFVQADGQVTPFPDNCFDGICCLRLFHLVPPGGRQAFVREFYRVLKPQGLLAVEFPRRLHAGGLAWLTAKITGKRRWYYLGIDEKAGLFRGFLRVRELGGYFPMMGRIAKKGPAWALRANLLIAHSWLRLFTRQAFLLFKKAV